MAIDTKERTSTSGASSSSNKKIIIIVLSVVGVLILLGMFSALAAGYIFTKGAENFISRNGEVTIQGDSGDDVKIETGTGAELPDDYPASDIPTYDNATVVSSNQMTLNGTESYVVVMLTSDSSSEVVDFYKNAFSGDDWKQVSSYSSGSDSVLNFLNEPKRMNVTVSVSEDGGETSVTISSRIGEGS